MNSDSQKRGRLKIFLGFAAGVGKTFRMLDEGRKLKQQGVDIIIGYFEPHGRQDTIEKAQGLETVPRRRISYRGHLFEEMDTDAIIRRRPEVCLVDEFAHTNVPGSERVKRWEDVLLLLDAGIDVYTNLNVQHLESLNDQVFYVTGIRVRETVPDWVVTQADEVLMVDLTVEALLNRLRRGAVYDPEKAEQAMQNFFKESTLAALRELALRQTAHAVELQHDGRLSGPPAPVDLGRRGPEDEAAGLRDKILVHVTADPATAMLIRRARRVADFLRADCFAVSVCPVADLHALPAPEREGIERHLNFARNLRLETRIIEGARVAPSLVEFSRRNGITHLYLARGRDRGWRTFFGNRLVFEVVRLARDIRITVVAERRSGKPNSNFAVPG